MNDNLLISIGANLSSYNSALTQAEAFYKRTVRNIEKVNPVEVGLNLAQFTQNMKNVEKKYAETRAHIINNALQFGFDFNPKELEKYADKYIELTRKSEAEAQQIKNNSVRASLDRQRILEQSSIRQSLNEQKRAALEAEAFREKIQAVRNASVRASLDRQRILEQSSIRQSLNEQREAALRLQRVNDYLFERRMRQMRAERAERARARIIPTGGGQSNDGGVPEHRSFMQSVGIVAKYGLISQALYGVQTAIKATIATAVEFDNALYKNMAVLDKTKAESELLNDQVKALGMAYGGSFKDIQEGLITLGRAGVSSTAGLSAATAVLKELSMITGDSMADGAAIMSSLVNVFGRDSADDIRNTGDQLAYVANETRLGIKDFSTISNYALTAAKSLGISQEAFLGLSGSLSKVGLNASTIGTSIRRLQKIIETTSDSNTEFFRILGVGQGDFSEMLRSIDAYSNGVKISDKAMQDLTTRLGELSDTDFTRATKDMDVLVKQTVGSLREIGKNNYFATMIKKIDSTSEKMKQLGDKTENSSEKMKLLKDQAQIMSVGFGVAMERIGNTLLVGFGDIITETAQAITGFEEFDNVSLDRITGSTEVLLNNVRWLFRDIGKVVGVLFADNPIDYLFGDAPDVLNQTVVSMKQLEKEYAKLDDDLTRTNESIWTSMFGLDEDEATRIIQRMRDVENKMLEIDKLVKKENPVGSTGWKELLPTLDDDTAKKLNDALGIFNKISGASSDYTKALSDNINAINAVVKANSKFANDTSTENYKELNKAILTYMKTQGIERQKINELKAKTFSIDTQTLDNEKKLSDVFSQILTSYGLQTVEVEKHKKIKDDLVSANENYKRVTEEVLRLNSQLGTDAESLLMKKENENTLKEANLRLAEAELASVNHMNSSLDVTIGKLQAAAVQANGLSTALFNASTALAMIQIDQGEASGKYDAITAAKLRASQGLNGIETQRLNVLRSIKAIEDENLILKKQTVDTSKEQKANIEAMKILSLSIVNIDAEKQKIILASQEAMRAATLEGVKQLATDERSAILAESAVKRFATTKEYTQEAKRVEAEIAQSRIREIDALISKTANQADLTKLLVQKRELETAELKKQQDYSKSLIETSNKGASEERARLKLVSDGVDLLKLSFDLKQAELNLEYAQNDTLLTSHESNLRDIQLAEDQLQLEIKTLAAMKEEAKLDADKATVAKKLARQEIVIINARTKAAKLARKEFTDLQNVMADSINGAIKSALSGDGQGMFNSLATNFEKAFTDASESVSTALTKVFTGTTSIAKDFDAMLEGLMMNPWMLAISIIIKALQSGLFSNTLSQAEIDAAKGRVEFDDDSLKNLASMFENAQYPMLEVTNKMHNHIRNMDSNFYAIARALNAEASQGGVDLTGVNFVDTMSSGFLGFSSESISLISSGLKFELQNLGDMMNAATLSVKGYTTTLVEESSLWGLISDSSIKKAFKNLPPSVVEDIADSFTNGYEAILLAGTTLGLNEVDLAEQLKNADINLKEIDFKGLSPSEVSDRLSQAFGAAFTSVIDGIGEFTVLVDRYAKDSEYALETLVRIATTYDQASHSFNILGKDFAEGTVDILKEWSTTSETIRLMFGRTTGGITTYFSEMATEIYTAQMQILDIVDSAGGMDSFNDAMSAFMGNFYTETEQLGFLTKSMEASFNTLKISIPQTNDEFRNLLETMDTSTEEGAYLYGQVLLLADGFSQMTKAGDDLAGTTDKITDVIKNIADTWLSDLSHLTLSQKAEYASGYLALAKESNGTISSVDAARLAAEAGMKSAQTREKYIPMFDRLISELENEIPDATNADIVKAINILTEKVIELEYSTVKVS